MGPEKHQKVLERLTTSDKATIAIGAPDGPKMRVTSGSWVILRDQVLEVRNVEGRLHIARKPRHHDEWDPHFEPYDPYGPGAHVIDDAGDKFADD
jgi:hypothetical protein